MDVDLRAGPSVAYSERLPELLWATGPDVFSFMFADLKSFSRLMPEEWSASFGLHCAPDSIVACRGEEWLGVMISYPAREVLNRILATFQRYYRALGEPASAELERRVQILDGLFPPAPSDALMVLNLAVVPQLHGQGIGARLMQEAEVKARRLGLSSIHLDTHATGKAVGFYRQLGYEPLIETRLMRPPESDVLPTLLRMSKTLG